MSFVWTGEIIGEVATYLKQGLSAAQIGAQLGISRNAVIGKVGREKALSKIGFAWTRAKPFAGKHPDKIKSANGKPRKPLPDWAKAVAIKPVEVLPFHVVGKPLMALGAYECRWAVSDNEPGDVALFCGCETVTGKSWCQYHAQKAYDARPLKSLNDLRVA